MCAGSAVPFSSVLRRVAFHRSTKHPCKLRLSYSQVIVIPVEHFLTETPDPSSVTNIS